jgi:TPR repeat protein
MTNIEVEMNETKEYVLRTVCAASILLLAVVALSAPTRTPNATKADKSDGMVSDKSGRDDKYSSRVVHVMPGEAFDISRDEMPGLEEKALFGSSDAAMRLCNYYTLVVRNMEKEAVWWCEMAAVNSNGNGSTEYDVGLQLCHLGDCRVRKRGMYWLIKSSRDGNSMAAYSLQDIRADYDRMGTCKMLDSTVKFPEPVSPRRIEPIEK